MPADSPPAHPGELVALDVHYDDEAGVARTGAVCFRGWRDGLPRSSHTSLHHDLAPYEPGSFYKRELPAILPMVHRVLARGAVGTVVLDGHVDLEGGRPGLGRHLYEALGAPPELCIVGVAKNPFREAPSLPVVRGDSAKPLWVSSTGDAEEAAAAVASMHGPHRLPTLLTLADHLARGHQQPAPEADVLELRWPGGRAAVAFCEEELPRAPHLAAPGTPGETVVLPASTRGLHQAVEVELRHQSGWSSHYALLAGDFVPDEVLGELHLRFCDGPPFTNQGLRDIHAAIQRGVATVSPLPRGRLDLRRLLLVPADSEEEAWARAGACLARLCCADTAGMGLSELNALVERTAAL